MSLFDGLRFRIRTVLRRGQHEREMDEEIRHHLKLEAEDGLSSCAARDRSFERVPQRSPLEVRGGGAWDRLQQDVRFAVRLLRRRAGFAAVTVCTMALGIGAATSIYSVADAVLFRPLAFPHPDELVTVWLTRPKWRANPALAPRWDRGGVSLPIVQDWSAAQRSFDAVAVWAPRQAMAGDPTSAEEVTIARASASLFEVLDVQPELGSWFRASDDRVGADPVTVISHEMWSARYGSDPAIVGATARVDGDSYTVIGVAPEGLSLDRSGTPIAYWIPAGQDAADASDRTSFGFMAIARLKPTTSFDAAALETQQFLGSVDGDDSVEGTALARLRNDQTRTVRQPLLILLAAAGLLLMIACVNVATLMLCEASRRQNEIRARAALGATRPRLVRQLLTESVVLTGAGGLAGVALAYFGTAAIVRSAPIWFPGLADVRVDSHALFLALMAAAGTGAWFGWIPALTGSRSSHQGIGLGSRGSSRGRGRLQRGFIACEVALSMVLLVGAGLLVRTFGNLSDLGFRSSDLLLATLELPRSMSDDSLRTRALFAELLGRVRTLPGITAAAATTVPPFSSGSSSTSFTIEGRVLERDTPVPIAQRRATSPEFFPTLGIPILEGRSYSELDRVETPLVVVVSRALARHHWPDGSAVGKRIQFAGALRTIVGVVGDIEIARATGDLPEIVYAPLEQIVLRGTPELILRTQVGPEETLADLRNITRDLGPDVKLARVDDMENLVAASLADDRLRTLLITLFAALAAVLAAVGTYGVAASGADRRTREMAIRMAVGATQASVGRVIVGDAAKAVIVGVAVGVGLAGVGTRILAPYLYGISAVDPRVYTAVAALLAMTTLAATWIPARRAMRVRIADTLVAD